MCACILSHFWLFATWWTVACQAPLSMGCPWQEYWNGLPCSPPGDLLNPGIKPASALQADSLPLNHWAFLVAFLCWKQTKKSERLPISDRLNLFLTFKAFLCQANWPFQFPSDFPTLSALNTCSTHCPQDTLFSSPFTLTCHVTCLPQLPQLEPCCSLNL